MTPTFRRLPHHTCIDVLGPAVLVVAATLAAAALFAHAIPQLFAGLAAWPS